MTSNNPVIIGLGYPLVDLVSSSINPSDVGLISGETFLASASSSSTYTDLFSRLLSSHDTKIIAGGSTLNTIRALQWLLASDVNSNVAAFMGCVGKDKFASVLQTAMIQDNVLPILEIKDDMQTGTSGVLISPDDGERTLVTYLGASKKLSLKFIQSEKQWEMLTNCRWIFSCGFMCQASADEHYKIVNIVAKMCLLKTEGGFALNLGAKYICQEYTRELLSLTTLSDIVFANKDEAFALAQSANWNSSPLTLEEISIKIAELQSDDISIRKSRRIVALTQGSGPTICALFDSNQSPHAISIIVPIHANELVPKEDIIDLNGVGDCFSGGFMAFVVKNATKVYTSKYVVNATRSGHWAASRVVRSLGASWEKNGEVCKYLLNDNED
jgi:adenosine kinase